MWMQYKHETTKDCGSKDDEWSCGTSKYQKSCDTLLLHYELSQDKVIDKQHNRVLNS